MIPSESATIELEQPVQVKVEELERKTEAALSSSELIVDTTSVIEKAALKPISQTEPQPSKPTLIGDELKDGSTMRTPRVRREDDNPSASSFNSYNGATRSNFTNNIAENENNLDVKAEVNSVKIGDTILAKSRKYDAWYRAVVKSIWRSEVVVDYSDWGMRETLDIKRIRRLTQHDLRLYLIIDEVCLLGRPFYNLRWIEPHCKLSQMHTLIGYNQTFG